MSTDYITIQLSKNSKKNANKHRAIIDAIDSELSTYAWHFHERSHTTYARSWFIIDTGKYVKKYLHNVVLARKLERDLLPHEQADHINGNGLDNRRENLRLATKSQNNANRRISKNNKSGYKGVSWHKASGKWVAGIKVNGKSINLGGYDTPEQAHKAYCDAAIKYFGEFANFGE